MLSWAQFAAQAPELAEFGRGLLDRFDGGAFLATVRGDGAPRLHPVVAILAAQRLWVFVNPQSRKFRDLVRDGRDVLHLLIDSDDKEFLVGGRAIAMNHARDLWEVVAQAAPYTVPHDRTPSSEGSHFLFELKIDRAAMTIWHNPGRPDTRPTRRVWRAGG
jgi:hypothetical protein